MQRLTGSLVIISFVLLFNSSVFAQQPDIAEGLYNNAISLMNQGLDEQALSDFWKIVRLYPSSAYTDDALYLIGKHHFNKNEYKESLEALNQVINSYGNLEWAPAAYYLKARIFMDTHYEGFDYKASFADFSRIFSIYVDSDWMDEGYYGAGLAAFELLDYQEARELFQHVSEEFPDSELAPAAQYYEGLCYILDGHVVWALQSFQKVIDLYPDSPFAEKSKGLNTLIYKTRFLPSEKKRHNYRHDSSFRLIGFEYDDAEAIAIDEDGVLAVSNKGKEVIGIYNPDGSVIEQKRIKLDISALFYDGKDLVIAAQDTIITRDGITSPTFLKKGEAEKLEKIQCAITDEHKNLYVVDRKYDGILKFERGSIKTSSSWPNSGLKDVEDIDRDFEDFIYAIDESTTSVIKYNVSGKEVGRIQREGSGYKMRTCDRLAIDSIGNIYLLDGKDDKIHLFSRDLTFIQSIEVPKKTVDFDVNYRGEILLLNAREKAVMKYF